jgi:TLC domain
MFDYFPLPNPLWLQERVAQPIADYWSLPTLPKHIHEVIFAAVMYQLVLVYVSPIVSKHFFSGSYTKLSRRTRLNWDIHVVSLVQSVVVCSMALYDIAYCEQRRTMNWAERIHGYTGGEALIQAFATGYFVWDLYVCTRYLSMFGPGMLAHAVSALNVYAWGYVSSRFLRTR